MPRTLQMSKPVAGNTAWAMEMDPTNALLSPLTCANATQITMHHSVCSEQITVSQQHDVVECNQQCPMAVLHLLRLIIQQTRRFAHHCLQACNLTTTQTVQTY